MFCKVGANGGSAELDLIRDDIDSRRPLSFFGLCVRLSDAGAREVRHTADFFWEVAAGTKARELAADASLQSLDSSQRESLTPSATWQRKDRDFLGEPSLLTTLALLDSFGGDKSYPVVGNLFQLNYVLLEAPTAGETITTNAGDRIWLQKVLCRDATASIELAMRQKPALQLAGLDPESPDAFTRFQELVNDGCLQFPLLSSIRVSVEQRRPGGKDSGDGNLPDWEQSLNMVIVEACEQDLTMQPNASYDGLLPCLKQCRASEDRLIVASLPSIVAAEHYPLAVRDGDVVRPCSKALAVIYATERTSQEGTDSDHIRLTTKNVSDALVQTPALFQLVSLCHRDKLADVLLSPPRAGDRRQAALVLITGVGGAIEFDVEAVQTISSEELPKVVKALRKLRAWTKRIKFEGEVKRPLWALNQADPVTTPKKCRTIGRHPSDDSWASSSN